MKEQIWSKFRNILVKQSHLHAKDVLWFELVSLVRENAIVRYEAPRPINMCSSPQDGDGIETTLWYLVFMQPIPTWTISTMKSEFDRQGYKLMKRVEAGKGACDVRVELVIEREFRVFRKQTEDWEEVLRHLVEDGGMVNKAILKFQILEARKIGVSGTCFCPFDEAHTDASQRAFYDVSKKILVAYLRGKEYMAPGY